MWALSTVLSSIVLAAPALLPPDAGAPPMARLTLCDAPTYALPPTIDLEDGLETTIRWMLEHSPTFRQQCRVLAASHISAIVRYALRPPGAAPRARAVFRERPSGLLIADIEIGISPDLTELLAHEFEHVLEQLDGVDLHRLARQGQAVKMPDGAFETKRAIAAGQRVMGEAVDNAPDTMRRASGSIWRAMRRAFSPR
jgi:hypothetical protein